VAGLLPSTRGLTAAEVAERRARHGRNAILEAPLHPWRDLVPEALRGVFSHPFSPPAS
jgi:hypothetical protein